MSIIYYSEGQAVRWLLSTGNDRPRIFRLDRDEAIISRCGFDSNGMGAVRRNLREFENRRCDYGDGILGINIGNFVMSCCISSLMKVSMP